ncbi:MAG: hypothetical protein F4210_00300, partial [Holophagales bacterium]|nr:hypothetical protein [Holophagales bacterium]
MLVILLGSASSGWAQDTPPALLGRTDWHSGTWYLYVTEHLDLNSVPAKDAFEFQIGGVDRGLESVGYGCYGPFRRNCGLSIAVKPKPTPTDEDWLKEWKFTYTPPTENPFQDLGGNAMLGFVVTKP